ncbi:cytochrome c oxidase assembly protein [Vreelandella sp. V005]|uniref:cytochrome c oxidase assembly protein n=1 Tax=Vreelandella sp. V005 TaxID=3459608 RepID=UPI004044EC90
MNAFGFIFSLLAVLYWAGYCHVRRRGQHWPFWRLGIFNLAAIAVVIVLSPPLMHWAHHDFRAHMMVHLIAGMVAPLGLVMASPISLALKCVPKSWGRFWVCLVARPLVRLVSHPITATLLNVGAMYALYMTDVYAWMFETPWLAAWLHWHFVIAGCLFTWAIAGPDPAPRRPSLGLRFGTLFVAMVAHATLAKWMYYFHLPSAVPLKELQQGTELMFYLGELTEAFLAYWLMRQWVRSTSLRDLNKVTTY